jgi:Tol biopolymer transport system component
MNRRLLFHEMIAVCAATLLVASAVLTAGVQLEPTDRSTRPAPVPAGRQLWTTSADVTYSSISPDGRFVTYVRSERNQGPALMMHDVIGGSDVRLSEAESKGSPGRAIFSPDSKRVAFNWTSGSLDEIRVVDLSGPTLGAPRVLVKSQTDTPNIWPGNWSSDGQWIVAIALKQDRTGHIALISVADGTIRSLKSLDFGRLWSFDSSHLFFSPDNRYVAYCRLDLASRTSSAWLVTVASGDEAAAVMRSADDHPAGWTADGSRLLFMSQRDGALGLWAQRLERGRPTGDPEPMVSSFEPNHVHSYLGLSRSGDVYFSVSARETRVAVAAFNSDSGTVSVNKEVPAGIQHDWSPDGGSLAYNNAKGPSDPSGHTLTIDSFGRRPTRVLRPRLLTWNWPRWSPDQRAFLVQGTDDRGRQGIYRVDATTADLETIALAASGEGHGFPQWFPDGQRIVYTRKTFNGSRPTAIVVRELASGQERILLESAGLSDECVLSPDGRSAAYIVRDQVRNRTSIEVATTTAGERRELVPLQSGASLGGWSPDSRSLVYSLPVTAGMETWIASLDGGQPRRIQLSDRLAQLARLSPDGKQIAYVIPNQSPQQVWVIEDPVGRTARR